MEAADKEKEAVPVPKTSPKEELESSPKPKADPLEKIAKENGSEGPKDVKAEPEKETNGKSVEDTGKSPVKQTESVLAKQNNIKPPEPIGKKSSRDEKYSRRKDERSVDQVMRALNAFDSPQEKLDALVKKYTEVFDENRKLQTQTKNIERRLTQVEREKDSAQSEHSKAVLARSRLEGLCRELQRQNRAIKDESILKIREEEEKRKEVSNKFQGTLAEITSLMQQNNEKNSKLRDDNIEMTTKFKSVCEQYELRVQQVEKISKQMQLEAQLADAKLAKANLEAKAEKEVMLRDKHELLIELAQYQARLKEQEQTELRLREQVELYTNKYDEFQTALSRSNEVFGGFKEEMDRMSKKIVKLEKETSTWKLRWEKSHAALLEMAADKHQRDAELSIANRQLTQLHKLCRTLTEERTKLMAQINAIGTPSDPTKEDKLVADIAEDRRKLNDTLDNLQSVILERELLCKQQQLERQQAQLQAELQKQITSAAASAEQKANDTKTIEKKDELKSEAKAPGSKNSETNKKKNKKQKSARQTGEKQAEEAKVESEVGTPQEDSQIKEIQEANAPIQVSLPLEEALEPPSVNLPPTSAVQEEIEPPKEEIPPLEPAPILPKPTPVSVSHETQVPPTTESPAPPISVPATDLTSAPVAFSYAAAVGSKPAEHAPVEKCQNEKTEEKSAVSNIETAPKPSESEPSKPVITTEVLPTVEAINGSSKPIIVDNPPIATEEAPSVLPASSPASKKSKESGKKKKNK